MENISQQKPEIPNSFAAAYKAANGDFKIEHALWKLFNEEMQKAMRGCICTPERMAALWPIFREINIEQEEIEAYWKAFEATQARRQAKKLEQKQHVEALNA